MQEKILCCHHRARFPTPPLALAGFSNRFHDFTDKFKFRATVCRHCYMYEQGDYRVLLQLNNHSIGANGKSNGGKSCDTVPLAIFISYSCLHYCIGIVVE